MSEANFFLKKPNVKGITLIYLFFSYNNKRLKYSTGEKIHTDFWNSDDQKVRETKKFPEYVEFNERLRILKSTVATVYRKILNDGKEPTNELIKHELDIALRFKEVDKPAELFSFIRKYIEECTPLKGSGTIAAYNGTLNLLEKYCLQNNKELNFKDIDLEFYNLFLAFLTKEDYSQNTIGKHIQVLKTFLNEATERGLNQSLEYKKRKFKRPSEETDNIYLNLNELEAFYNLKLHTDKQLDSIRDLFLIGCFTGLRFSDFTEIRPENILDGNKIKITTNKTNEMVVIPLHRYVREILSKYKNELPKALCNQKMNIYLKHLGERAKVKELVEVAFTKGGVFKKDAIIKYKLICTHTARRSFATNLFLADIPAITIMKITGHRTEKSFLRYIRISQEENANKLLDHPFFK